MTTLHHLELAVMDMTERMRRELQFSSDAKKQIRDSFILLHDALANVERAVTDAMDERMLALSTAIGTGKPEPEMVDHMSPAPKLRSAKQPTEAPTSETSDAAT